MVHVAWQAIGAIVEVFETKSGDHREDNVIVRHVEVEGLTQWELSSRVVKGVINAGFAGCDQFMLEAGGKFQDIADALSTAGWGAIGIVSVVLHIDVVGEVFPLLLCK